MDNTIIYLIVFIVFKTYSGFYISLTLIFFSLYLEPKTYIYIQILKPSDSNPGL